MRAAEGAPLESYRATADDVASGVSRHTTSLHRGDDYRETSQAGPVTTSSGSYRGERWRQNENGETILLAPDPGLVAPENFTSTVTRVATPVDGYLVSTLNAAGFGTRRYVEASTWRVVRVENVSASRTVVTTYDDFRTVGGHTFAFHVTRSDGDRVNDSDLHVTDVRAAPVTDAELAVPASSRTLVAFPAGASTVMLPVRMDRTKFVVRVRIGGRGLDLALDSGAAGIVLEDDVVRQLGLTEFGRVDNLANAGNFQQSSAIVPEIAVGDLTMHDVFIRTIPPIDRSRFMEDTRVVGLLGFDFIDAMALKLDYQAGTVTAYAPGTFVPPAEPGTFAADVRIGGGVPLVSLAIDDAVGERFLLDTGGYGSVLIKNRFVRRHPNAIVDEGGPGNRDPIPLMGVGGRFEVKPYELARIVLGPVTFKDFLAYVITDPRIYDDGKDGIVGPGFLHLFDVTFDYAHAKAYFRLRE